MKIVVLLLVVANLVYFAWQYPQHRLLEEKQLAVAATSQPLANADVPTPSLLLLKELPPTVAKKVVTVNIDKPTSVVAAVVSGKKGGAVVAASPAAACWALGPFGDGRQADRGLTMLTAQGVKGRTRERKGSVLSGYRVKLPGQATRAAAQRTIRELRGRGVKDIAMLANNGRYFVSLGFFSKRTSARQRSTVVAKLGYKPLMEKIYRDSSGYWLDLYKATDPVRLDKAWAQLSNSYPKVGRKSINCPKER